MFRVVYFEREVSSGTRQDLGQQSSLIPLMIIINMRIGECGEFSGISYFSPKGDTRMRCKSVLLSNE